MKNSKLYSILQAFDKYEQNRCRKYVQSPYFNVNEELIQLFETLIDHINETPEDELCKEEVWCVLQPSKRYDDVRFRKYCSDLLKLVEGFLAQEVYEDRRLDQANNLIEAVGERKLEKLYKSTMRRARRLLEKQKYRHASYFYHNYEVEKNYYELTQFNIKREVKSNIEQIINNLDWFYLAEKLKYLCEVQSRKVVASHDYKVLFTDEILMHLNKNTYDSIPPVAIYFQIYKALEENEEPSHYYKLKELLNKYGLTFPKSEASEIYTFALNYCTQQINKGKPDFLKEIFDLYKDLLEKEILIQNGELAPWHFRNIVVVGLRLGEYDWIERFIHEYNIFVPESFRENAISFNLANLYFYQKKYNKVIELLQTVEYEDFSYNLNSKLTLLLTYYETDEIEALYSLMESFRAYLNRHKNFPEYRRRPYMNLIKYTKKLTKILPGEQDKLKKLTQEVEQVGNNIANAKWLKEKIAELEG